MAEKKNALSITLGLIDKATAPLRAFNARIAAMTAPIRALGAKLSGLADAAGLPRLIDGFKGVGNAIGGLLTKVGLIGGAVGFAVVGLFKIVDGFDELGDKAEAAGVAVDTLAQLRYAADSSGASVEGLDAGLIGFNKSVGQARAGTGRMLAFLNKVSPALAAQVKGAKNTEEALGFVSDAMMKLENSGERAALAQATLGDVELAGMLAKGSKGIQELRDEHFKLARSQEAAVAAAGRVDGSLKKLGAVTDGVKARLMEGLAPALEKIVDKLTKWFEGNQDKIAKWAADVGEKLPAAVEKVVDWIGKAYDKVTAFVESVGGLKNVAIAAGLILAGPLISSVVTLGAALVRTGIAMAGLFSPTRVAAFIAQLRGATGAMTGLGAATGKAGSGSGAMGAVGGVALPIAAAMTINELSGGSFEDQARAKGFEGKDGDLFGAIKYLSDAAKNRTDASAQLRGAFDAGRARPDVSGQAREAASAGGMAAKKLHAQVLELMAKGSLAKVEVDIKGPPGTRAKIDPKSTADIDVTTTGSNILYGF